MRIMPVFRQMNTTSARKNMGFQSNDCCRKPKMSELKPNREDSVATILAKASLVNPKINDELTQIGYI